MDLTQKLVQLLEAPSPRTRVAAAVVVGELGLKDGAVVARLMTLAADPVDALAEPAVEALGKLRAGKALPVLLATLGRSRELAEKAREAIAALGAEVLPDLRARMDEASPEVRATLSQLLPAVGGRQSFELALEGLRGQGWDAVNKVALSVRHEAKTMSVAERRVLQTQVEKFLGKKKTADDEPALRGALKVLGFLELPESVDTLLTHLGPRQPPAVRVEATQALRFPLGVEPTKKGLKALITLLSDGEATVVRAARDSLTVLPVGAQFAPELAQLCQADDGDVALWAIARLGALAGEPGAGGKLAGKTLEPVARGEDRVRAQAAAKALAVLPKGRAALVSALAGVDAEAGAQVLAEVLAPFSRELGKAEVATLLAAGCKNLGRALAVARWQLEPVRAADGEAWASALRQAMKGLQKKDPARADAIGQLLARSGAATADDRYAIAVQQLAHHNLDPHPRARQRDTVLAELERLVAEHFKLGEALARDARVTDEARYYVGVHLAEKPSYELKNQGATLLEALAKGRTKLAKAAKNKLALLDLA
jgi:hypothetical protein